MTDTQDIPVEDEVQKLSLQSQLLQNSPIFTEAIETLREDIFNKWLNSDFNDVENREGLFKLYVSLEMVGNRLDSYIVNAEQPQEDNNTDEPFI